MINKGRRILKGIAFGILGILAVFLFGWLTMSLWNWLVPSLFNGPVIGFWQALGLLILSKILFGGFGGGGRHRGSSHWKHRYNQKLATMSPEDRERFKERMRQKWCSRDQAVSVEKPGDSNV